MILTKNCCLFIAILMLSGCGDRNVALLEDVSRLKIRFISEVLEGAPDESPFHFSYNLRTIFYSKNLVSFFGEFHQYTHLPHGSTKYEGCTFYKKNGEFIQLALYDLISTKMEWEFVRNHCENVLKNDPCTYFSGKEPLRTALELEDLNTFTLDDQALILVFQPYTVAGGTDGPPIVRVPWDELSRVIIPSHPFHTVLKETVRSKAFTSSWDENAWERSLRESNSQIDHSR